MVGYQVGDSNVTFRCSIFESSRQRLTQWNILNFRGTEGGLHLSTAVPSVIIGGTPNPAGILAPTFNDYVVFPTYSMDLANTTLTCGGDGEIFARSFHLEVYRESKYI